MKERTAAEERLVQFLLGGLPEAEHEAVEERLFTDEELQAALDKVTDDLIHDSLAGRLSPEERRRFEAHFLAAARHRERLAFIQDLTSAARRVIQAETPRPRPAPGIASPLVWAAAASVLLAIAVLAGRRAGPQMTAPPPPPATPEASVSAAGPTPLATIPPSDDSSVRVVRLGPPGRTAHPVSVGPAMRTVRLEVPVEDGPPSFDAAVRIAGGAEVWRAEGLVPERSGRTLVVAVPAHLLTTADYVLSIEGEPLRLESSPPAAEFRLHVVRAVR